VYCPIEELVNGERIVWNLQRKMKTIFCRTAFGVFLYYLLLGWWIYIQEATEGIHTPCLKIIRKSVEDLFNQSSTAR